MDTLSDAAAVGNAAASDVYAYLDTVELFFPPLRREAYQEVARYERLEECRRRDGQLVGCRLIRNWPSISKDWLQHADLLARKYRGVLHRVDVAVDTKSTPGLREQIVNSAVLKWSTKEGTHDRKRTVYWVHRKGRRSRRQLVLYDDKPSKITGEPCLHLELRLFTAPVIRRQGLHKPGDLLGLNPKQLFDRHVIWSDTADRYVKRQMRKEHSNKRKQYANQQLHPVMDRYIASIPKRVQYLLERLGLDRSQNARKDMTVQGGIEAPLGIPTELEWVAGTMGAKANKGSLKSLGNSKIGGYSGCLSLAPPPTTPVPMRHRLPPDPR
jgi:hypothetical protein